jgi:hypothetical protein
MDSTQEQPTPAEIQPGDPRLRRMVFYALGTLCLIAVAGVLLLERRLAELQEIARWDVQAAAAGMYRIAEFVIRGVGAGAILLGLWCCWTAVGILRSARFPAPGTRVLRDTPVLHGTKARYRGLSALLLGLVLLGLGLWYPPRALARVQQTLIHAITTQPFQVGFLSPPPTPCVSPCTSPSCSGASSRRGCAPGAGTFYAFPDVSGALETIPDLSGDIQFAEFLLEQAEVAVVPGSAFGAPGHLRLSFACGLETLETAIGRIEAALT